MVVDVGVEVVVDVVVRVVDVVMLGVVVVVVDVVSGIVVVEVVDVVVHDVDSVGVHGSHVVVHEGVHAVVHVHVCVHGPLVVVPHGLPHGHANEVLSLWTSLCSRTTTKVPITAATRIAAKRRVFIQMTQQQLYFFFLRIG